jgi:pilus assembly protein CpaE
MEASDSSIRAFAVDAETEKVLKEALSGRGAQVQRGDMGVAIKTLAASASPRLIFVDLDGSEFPTGRIHELAAVCEFGTLVVAISSNDTARFTRELLACGVSDYLPKPISVSDIHEAMNTALKDDDAAARLYAGRVIAFASCGGSGATTLAALAAHAAAAQGSYVSVLDLERTSGALPLMLDVEPAVGLDELLDIAAKTAEPNPDLLDGVRTAAAPRISVYGYRPDDSPPPQPTAGAVQWLTEQLANRSHLVIVDGLADTDTLFSVLENADERVLVFEPTLVSLSRVVYRLARLGKGRQVLLVENHTRMRKSALSAEEVRYTLAGRNPDITMPFEPTLPSATNYGSPDRTLSRKYRKALAQLTSNLARQTASLATAIENGVSV